MTLRLRNRWSYRGDGGWDWEAFLDDSGSGELRRVEFVDYLLHETFPEPRRRVADPDGGFRLAAAGFGDFDLKAFVHFRDGTRKRLVHTLELRQQPALGISKD
jgi:transcription initiation factor IIF auxiliary subunit